jgi:hypothetical protein
MKIESNFGLIPYNKEDNKLKFIITKAVFNWVLIQGIHKAL